LRNGAGAVHQVTDETFQVIDQALLEDEHGAGLGLLYFHAAGDAGHEGLGVLGQILEHTDHIPQHLMHLGVVRGAVGAQGHQGFEAGLDVLQGDALQLAAALEHLREGRQRRLHRFSAVGEPIEEARQIEVVDAGHPRRIRLRFEVAPVHQLRERRPHLLQGGRIVWPGRFAQYLVRPQIRAELTLGGGEDFHDGAVKRGLVGADVAEEFAMDGGCVHVA
jgi:hypothetical protein